MKISNCNKPANLLFFQTLIFVGIALANPFLGPALTESTTPPPPPELPSAATTIGPLTLLIKPFPSDINDKCLGAREEILEEEEEEEVNFGKNKGGGGVDRKGKDDDDDDNEGGVDEKVPLVVVEVVV